MAEHVVVCMMTSQIVAPHFPHDVLVSQIEVAGLPKPTLIRLSKIVTLDSQLIVKKLGRLHAKDQSRVKAQFSALFNEL
jgi:hypothetical protein